MDRQLALQRGFQALEDELGGLTTVGRGSVRRPRRRERKRGSWRDQGKGECFTRPKKNGGVYTVCNDPPRGSKGQKGVYDVNNRNVRGDDDQKGRKKDKAIKNNRSVMKKYDDEGRVEDLDEEIYFTPLREEGGFVILGKGLNTAGTAKNPDGISDNVDTVNTIRVPKDEFNAQYRVMRGFTNPDDKYNDLAPAEYGLQEDPDKAQEAIKVQREVRGERLRQEGQQERVDEFVREAQQLGGGREGFRRRQRRRELGRQAIRKIRETQQDRLNREQRRRDLVESFEDKVKKLDRMRRFLYYDEEQEDLDKLEREVGQELDRRERIRREEREERERREQREREERDEQEKQEKLRAALRTVRERRAGAIQPNQFYFPMGTGRDELRTDDGGFGVSFAVDAMREAMREAEEEEGVEEKKESKKEKKKKKKDKRKKSSKEKDKERAKEEQGEDFDEEDWEDDYEEYLENKKEFDENKEEFRKEPLVKRLLELSAKVNDLDGADIQQVKKIDKETGRKEKEILVDYKGQQFIIRQPRDNAIDYGYDGSMGGLLEISLKGTIDKLEKLLAL